jgi:hypothetical protein
MIATTGAALDLQYTITLHGYNRMIEIHSASSAIRESFPASFKRLHECGMT